MGGTRRVANDPLRRQRILDAALAVIAERGVHGTSHRGIAAEAGVPLGSLTYYFDSLDAIFEQAFQQLADSMSEHYRTALTQAGDVAEACLAVTDLICGDQYASARELTLLHEMYAYANHSKAVAETCAQWLGRSRASLSQHFPDRAARAIDALIEGWPMHQAWEHEPLDRELVRATITAIAQRFA
ncbi:TetR/AcrR family transcriptional regulator [Actinoplanes sp. TFC3]|uniref:TetR/AcrR family transcriptional regulator n=1 Tax=Actinoplanes sp. TFC3 TaxID=1710355 RepID=UPI00082F6E79|nr:TetR family transcriptional regulator [Actinoplanes sp. TFC3]